MFRTACWIGLACASCLNAATLIHSYDLTTSTNDQVGSANLNTDGGTLVAGVGYQFQPNQGLFNPAGSPITDGLNYTFLLRFEFDRVDSYRKIMDLTNLNGGTVNGGGTSDPGLYNIGGNLQWFNFAPIPSGAPIVAGQFVDVVVTRDGTTGAVTGYVNGAQQFSFTDSTPIATFQNNPNQIVRFFEDDNVSGTNEASGGTATLIQVFDGALSAREVALLPESLTPEPATWSLLVLGSAAALLRRRR
jgi:hypothetical protein